MYEKNVQVEIEARDPSWKLGQFLLDPVRRWVAWDPVQPGWVSGIIHSDAEVLGKTVRAGIQIRAAKTLKYGSDGSREEGCGTQ